MQPQESEHASHANWWNLLNTDAVQAVYKFIDEKKTHWQSTQCVNSWRMNFDLFVNNIPYGPDGSNESVLFFIMQVKDLREEIIQSQIQ